MFLSGQSSGAHISALALLDDVVASGADIDGVGGGNGGVCVCAGLIGMSGVYDVAAHYAYETSRGVAQACNHMCRRLQPRARDAPRREGLEAARLQPYGHAPASLRGLRHRVASMRRTCNPTPQASMLHAACAPLAAHSPTLLLRRRGARLACARVLLLHGEKDAVAPQRGQTASHFWQQQNSALRPRQAR